MVLRWLSLIFMIFVQQISCQFCVGFLNSPNFLFYGTLITSFRSNVLLDLLNLKSKLNQSYLLFHSVVLSFWLTFSFAIGHFSFTLIMYDLSSTICIGKRCLRIIAMCFFCIKYATNSSNNTITKRCIQRHKIELKRYFRAFELIKDHKH